MCTSTAGQHVGLYGGAERDDRVGIEIAQRLAAEQRAHEVAHHRRSGRAADEDHPVELGGSEFGILDGAARGAAGALEQRLAQRGQLGPHHRARERPAVVERERGGRGVGIGQRVLGGPRRG